MPILGPLNNPTAKKIIGVIVFTFLITFILSRLTVYLVLDRMMPNFFLTIHGVHIHHFAYGVFIIAVVGLYMFIRRPEPETKRFYFALMLYGVGLGLTVDEFGMWIRLEDDYWVRQSYDAAIITIFVLLNIGYFDSIRHLFTSKFWNRIKRTN